QVTAVNGIATFSGLQIQTAGNLSLQGSTVSGGNILLSTSSLAIAVSPAAATHLVVAQAPSSGTAGSNLTVKVEVDDQFGNRVTSDQATSVTLTLKTTANPPQTVAFSAGTNPVTVVSGLATFNDLQIDTIGGYTITASVGGGALT